MKPYVLLSIFASFHQFPLLLTQFNPYLYLVKSIFTQFKKYNIQTISTIDHQNEKKIPNYHK